MLTMPSFGVAQRSHVSASRFGLPIPFHQQLEPQSAQTLYEDGKVLTALDAFGNLYVAGTQADSVTGDNYIVVK